MDLLFIVLLVILVAAAAFYWWFFMKKKNKINRVDVQDTTSVPNANEGSAVDTVVSTEHVSSEPTQEENSDTAVSSVVAEDDGGSESTKS